MTSRRGNITHVRFVSLISTVCFPEHDACSLAPGLEFHGPGLEPSPRSVFLCWFFLILGFSLRPECFLFVSNKEFLFNERCLLHLRLGLPAPQATCLKCSLGENMYKLKLKQTEHH